MGDDLFITVPITQEYNSDKVIGSMQILKSELPLIPNFLFAIGYRILEMDSDSNITKYELVTVYPILDTYLVKTNE